MKFKTQDNQYLTDKNYGDFKKFYTLAVTQKREVFLFEGQQILTSYAKYVVEHLEPIEITREQVRDWQQGEKELAEIIADIANMDYKPEVLRSDILQTLGLESVK